MMKPKFVNVINYQYNIECAYNWIDCAKKPSNCTVCKYNPTFSKINLVLSCVCQVRYYDICQEKLNYYKDDPILILSKNVPNAQQNVQLEQQINTNVQHSQPELFTKYCVYQDGYYVANLFCFNLSCKLDKINPPNCVSKYHYYDDLIHIEQQEYDVINLVEVVIIINVQIVKQIYYIQQKFVSVQQILYHNTETPWCSTCTVVVVTGIFSDDLSNIQYPFEFHLLFNFPYNIQAQCQQILSKKKKKAQVYYVSLHYIKYQLYNWIFYGIQCQFIKTSRFNDQTITKILIEMKLIFKLNYQLQASPCPEIQIIMQQNITGERNLQLLWSHH